jgi:hypothetical protein
MAHFARIENGTVTEVVVVKNAVIDIDGVEDEAVGIAFLRDTYGQDTDWVQTSYTGNPVGGVDRGPFAGLGYAWDGAVFAAPVPTEPEEPLP